MGILQAQTENGIYHTVIKDLVKEFGNKTEISYQSVFQPGVSKRIWNLAKNTAWSKFKSTNLRYYKQKKFGMAPTGLIIYVENKSLCKPIMKRFIETKW